jgi:magnesium-transporting ATPase (P-type)
MQLRKFHLIKIVFMPFLKVQIPADGLLIEGHSLLIDESSMTGESEPVCAHLYSSDFFNISGTQKQKDNRDILQLNGTFR